VRDDPATEVRAVQIKTGGESGKTVMPQLPEAEQLARHARIAATAQSDKSPHLP
jgi:hypothetical protein